MLDLKDKTILVSTRKIDESGNEDTETFFGRVVSSNESSVVLARVGAGEITMPYDEDVLEIAEPGFYELKDGTTHENPDFIARWVVYASQDAKERFAGSRNP